MAFYSDNRGKNLEIKYLRKMLGQVDDKITLPDSLKGDALLHRLDSVEQQVPPMSVALIKPRQWLNARSGFAYAAAFLLMVGLFYGLGFDRQNNLVDGSITLERGREREILSQLEIQDETPKATQPPELSPGDIVVANRVPEAATPSMDRPATFAAPPDTSAPAGNTSWPEEVGGVLSTQLCTFREELVVAYRPTDENDPELGASNVVEILDSAQGRLMALAPLPGMERVRYAFAGENLVAVVGEGDGAAYVHIIDFSSLEEPKTLEVLTQSGKLNAARAFEETVHIVSYTSQPSDLGDVSAVELPNSSETGAAIFTAFDLEQGNYRQMAVLGAGEEIKLYNLSAYVYYDGVTLENEREKEDIFVAQIKLIGQEMELTGIS